MNVTAWNNGKHHPSGAGYGLKIKRSDRDHYFSKSWEMIFMKLPSAKREIEINIKKDGFWNSCPHLITKEIGRWLIDNGYIPWPKGNPPKFELIQIHDNHFELYGK